MNTRCDSNVIPKRKNSKYPSQDIIIHNQVIEEHNHKECKQRYTILQGMLSRYTRPFTMLDIGARQGYFSLRAAYNYPQSVFVMIEDNTLAKYYPNSNLLDICIKNKELHNIILFNKEIIEDDLQRLSECEHFDLVVAFDLFSSYKNDWRNIIEKILNLGDNILIEVPNEQVDLKAYLKSNRLALLWKFENSDIWFFEGQKNLLLRRHWLRPLTSTLAIESNYESKKLIKDYDKIVITDWVPGINLVTFKMCSGIYPTCETIGKGVRALKEIVHSDWLAHNMIVQGNTLTMIDCNDPRHDNTIPIDSRRNRMLFKILEWIKIDNPREVAAFYHHKHMEYM